jgi:hypothetical protein
MTELQIFDCQQGTPEWYAARAGIPTASRFATVMAQGKTRGSPSVTRRKYMLQLIGERLTGEPMDSYENDHMDRGKRMEGEARSLYAMVRKCQPQAVGFMRRGDAGCSPDSLIDSDGLLEVKTKLPHLQIEMLLEGRLPPEHVAQVQGQLWISSRAWLDFVSYWPALPIFIHRVYRDEAYIARIKVEVDDFLEEMAAVMKQVEEYKPA